MLCIYHLHLLCFHAASGIPLLYDSWLAAQQYPNSVSRILWARVSYEDVDRLKIMAQMEDSLHSTLHAGPGKVCHAADKNHGSQSADWRRAQECHLSPIHASAQTWSHLSHPCKPACLNTITAWYECVTCTACSLSCCVRHVIVKLALVFKCVLLD